MLHVWLERYRFLSFGKNMILSLCVLLPPFWKEIQCYYFKIRKRMIWLLDKKKNSTFSLMLFWSKMMLNIGYTWALKRTKHSNIGSTPKAAEYGAQEGCRNWLVGVPWVMAPKEPVSHLQKDTICWKGYCQSQIHSKLYSFSVLLFSNLSFK